MIPKFPNLTDLHTNSIPINYISEERRLFRAGEEADAGICVIEGEVRAGAVSDTNELSGN